MTTVARETFRRYLEESGLTDSITRVLSHLYDEYENPVDPMQYLKDHLGCPPGVDAADLKAKNAELRAEISRLEAQLETLKRQK